MIKNGVIDQLIKQEERLLEKTDSPEVLADLIDNEFIEIGSAAVVYDKKEVIRWLASDDQSERVGTAFKAHVLAMDVILLTYICTIKKLESKQSMRSSIWRLKEGQWRMVFHQGTPLK